MENPRPIDSKDWEILLCQSLPQPEMNGLCYGSNCISSWIYIFLRLELILFNLENSYVLGKIKMFSLNTSISKALWNISKAFYSSIFTSCRWVTESCPTLWGLCDPIDCSIPGFPVLHYLLEFVQTPVHWVGDATQPSHPLSPPSPPALNLSQHQGIFQWVSYT